MSEVEVESAKISNGLSSKKSAMKRLENFTDEEVEKELQRIQQEGINSGAVNPNNSPQL